MPRVKQLAVKLPLPAGGPDDVDVVRFERLVATGRRLVEEGEVALASATLGEVLVLRRGSRWPSSPMPASLTSTGRI
jgi:hypothetical protein